MLLCKDLGKWSMHIVHVFDNDPCTSGAFAEFSKIFKRHRPAEEFGAWMQELESAYRSFLAQLILNQHPLVTPSSMLIDAQVNMFRKTVAVTSVN